MRKLTKLDLQALAETMPVIPVDEQRGYLAMGSYGPELPVTYFSEEDIANFMSGLDRTEAYANDCVFATAAFGNAGGTNDQAEINKLAEEWVLSNTKYQPALQEFIMQGMTSEEAAKAYLKKNSAEITMDEATTVYNKHLLNTGVTVMIRPTNGGKSYHWTLVTGCDSEMGTYYYFDGSEGALSDNRMSSFNTLEGGDYQIWSGATRVGRYNGVMGYVTSGGVFTPYGNDSGSGSSSDDGNGSNDGGSSGSSGDNPWYPGNSSGY